MIYNVKKNIQLPERPAGRPRKYPFDKCEVDDGFEVPRDKANAARSSLQVWRKNEGVGQEWVSCRLPNGGVAFKRVK